MTRFKACVKVIQHLSVRGVITNLRVFPTYSYEQNLNQSTILIMHLLFEWSVYQGNLQNCLDETSLFLSIDHSNLSCDCQAKDSASITLKLTKFWTTSLLCTSMVMMLITFILYSTSNGLVTLLISFVILFLITSTHYFMALSAPDDSYSNALFTSSVHTI